MVDHNSAGRPELTADSAGAWLVSAPVRFLGRANPLIPGPAIATTSHVGLPVTASAVTRRRGGTLVVDVPGSRAATMDLRTLAVAEDDLEGDQQVDTVGGRRYLIDPAAGSIARLPDRAVVARAGSPLGEWTVSGGALWATVPATGAVLRVDQDGSVRTRPSVFAPGDRPPLAGSPSGVALADGSTLTLLTAAGVLAPHALPGTPSRVAVAPDGTFAASLDGPRLSLVPLAGGAPKGDFDLPPNDAWGGMTINGGAVYLTDDTTGSLWMAGGTARTPVAVAGHPTHLELFTQGGMTWANDPAGPAAVAVAADGHVFKLVKYAIPDPSATPPAGRTPTPSPTTRPPTKPSTTQPSTTQPSTTQPPRTQPPRAPHTPDGPGPATKTPVTGRPTPSPSPTKSRSPAPEPATASFSDLHGGQEVGNCAPARGGTSIPKDDTLLLAVRRTDPPDPRYYFTYAASRTGNVHGFATTVYFGDTAGQGYRVQLLIMNVADADAFYQAHSQDGGNYAMSTSIPGKAERADSVSVRQTTTECNA